MFPSSSEVEHSNFKGLPIIFVAKKTAKKKGRKETETITKVATSKKGKELA
jgi:hypothetical protein